MKIYYYLSKTITPKHIFMVGKRIRHFRELNKLKREVLADELGIDASQINRIENNQSEITVSRLLKIASFFKVSVIELFEEKDLNIENPKFYENYGPVDSSFIRYVIYQNELRRKENEEHVQTCKLLLETMQEQHKQFKRLMDYISENNKKSKPLKLRGGGVKKH